MKPEEITRMLENIPAEKMQDFIKYMATQKAEHEAVAKGKTNKDIVRIYLEQLSKSDPELAAKFPNNPMGKTIDDCMDHILNLARKTAGQGARENVVNSFTVFEWAVRYFLDDEIKKCEKPKPVTTSPSSAKLTPKQKLEALLKEKKGWEQNNKKRIDEWEVDNNAKIDQWEKEHAQDLFPAENPHTKNVNPWLSSVFPKQAELDKLLAAQKDNPEPEPADEPEDDPETITDEPEQEEGEEIPEATPEELAELSLNK